MNPLRLECTVIEDGVRRDVEVDGTQVLRELVAALQVAAVIRDMPPAIWSAFVARDPATIDRLVDQFAAAQGLLAMCNDTVADALARLMRAAGRSKSAAN